jgi:hypothetical protein
MHDRVSSEPSDASAPVRMSAAKSAPPAPVRPSVATALSLQRTVGNRAATRLLARWAAHPDKDKKGVLMTDAAAARYNALNPPLSK